MDWPTTVADALGIEGWSDTEQQLVLDMARDVAHGTERRYAPLTAYALGLVVGAGTATDDGVADATARADRLRALVDDLVGRIDPEMDSGTDPGEPA